MAPQKSPAFQFYAKDFLTGTATMSLAERGAYVSLLAYQWDAGIVPDDPRARARILGCNAGEQRTVWAAIASKFTAVDGGYQNSRLEEEREKQAEFRRRQSDRGKASAATRRQPESNQRSNAGSTSVQPSAVDSRLEPKSNSSSSSSSSSTQEVSNSPTTKHRSVPTLIVGGGEYVRLLETNAFVGSVLRVPKKLHSELLGKSGGAHREQDLQDWYLSLNEQLETSGKGTGDIFEWLRPRHQALVKERGWVDAAPRPNSAPPPIRIQDILDRDAAKKAGAK